MQKRRITECKSKQKKAKVTSPTLGTGRKRLWLLRSRPDQVDRATMRGGPSRRSVSEKRYPAHLLRARAGLAGASPDASDKRPIGRSEGSRRLPKGPPKAPYRYRATDSKVG